MRRAQPLEGGRAMTTVEAAANLLLYHVKFESAIVSALSLPCCKFTKKTKKTDFLSNEQRVVPR